MTLYYEDAGLRLWHGSNREILPTFADESFDSIVTDPPYELGFMGKGWDSSGIAYDVDVWRECLRVLKPGGHLLAFGGSRTWHRMAVAIEDAGFEMRDSIAWLYGQGFSKSMDVSKAIDKAAGAERSVTGPGRWAGRESANDFGIVNDDSWTGGAPRVETEPATDAAREWEGWGTSLKPAFEPLVVARKPLAGTVVATVLAYGTGGLNIDACRVALEGTRPLVVSDRRSGNAVYGDGLQGSKAVPGGTTLGRLPTNVLLSHSPLLDADGAVIGDACAAGCVPDCAVAALDVQTGVLTSGVMKARTNRQPRKGGVIYGADKRNIVAGDTYGDSGGASRFFPSFRYEAKAPTSERPNVEGTVHATVKPLALIRWLVRLVTRPGGRVLDLYAGSGTTGEAALLEGMEVDLIELEEDHLPLILARVRKPLQPSMFGDWEDAS